MLLLLPAVTVQVLTSYLANEDDILMVYEQSWSEAQAVQLAPVEAAVAWGQLQQHFPR